MGLGVTINEPTRARQKATLLGIVATFALAGLAVVGANSKESRPEGEFGVFRVALQASQTKTKLPPIEPLVREETGQVIPPATTQPEAEMPDPIAQPLAREEKVAAGGGGDILKLSYRLEPAFDAGPDGVEVLKRLVRDGAGETDLPIYLMGGTRIEIERDKLASALAELKFDRQVANLPDKPRLTLENLRSSGVDLSYDAIRDRLVLKAAPEGARP